MIDDFQAEPRSPTAQFPWPPREDDSVINALATTWKESVFQPASFFRAMPREFDFGWVLGYYLLVGVAAGGISLFWRMVLGPTLTERLLPEAMQAAGGNPIVDFLLSPLFLVIALFLATAVVHVCLLVLRGAQHGFGTSLRVFCYSSGPQLFCVVPFVGTTVGGIWTLVITVIGLREAQQTSTGKALASILLPMFFFLTLIVLMVIAGTLAGLGRVVG